MKLTVRLMNLFLMKYKLVSQFKNWVVIYQAFIYIYIYRIVVIESSENILGS
jgi:hypothetical protein